MFNAGGYAGAHKCIFFTTLCLCVSIDLKQHSEGVKMLKQNVRSANDRYLHIDLIKLVSILGIMFIHTGSVGMYLYQSTDFGMLRAIYLFFNGLSSCAVPLFFMCSGAMLIKKQESLKTLLLHRVFRFAIVIVIIQAFNYIYMFLPDPFSHVYLEYYIQILFSGLFADHLWFLYSYLAFLLILPFLRRLVSAMEAKDYIYLFAVYLLFRCTELVQIFLFKDTVSLNPSFSISFFLELDVFFYPILGHYLQNVFDTKNLGIKNAAALFAAALLCVIFGCMITEFRITLSDPSATGSNILRSIPCAALFLGAKMFFENTRCPARVAKLLSIAGNCTFGVYLFENVLRDHTEWLFNFFSSFLPPMTSCLLWLAGAMLIAIPIVFVLKKIPVVKKLL